MNTRVLFVDDETSILSAVKRAFMSENVDVLTAESGEAALGILKAQPVAVIVSDNMMPHMNGIEFFEQSKKIAPESIRIMMTGYADMRAAIDSINRGGVTRFITKPWNDDELKEAVVSGVERYNVVSSLKNATESTLLSLAQTIELKDPYTKGHCDRVAQLALGTAERLGLSEEEKRDIRQGSWLHDCGKIGVPEGILNLNGKLTEEQMSIVMKHPTWGAEVATLAKLPDAVVGIIRYHHERFDGTGYPSGLKGPEIPYLARIVAVADVYDALATDRPYRKAMSSEKTRQMLVDMSGSYFDPDILHVFMQTI